jgi:hypothetical protein
MGDDPAATTGEETDTEAGAHTNGEHEESSRDGADATADTTGPDHGTDATTVGDPTNGDRDVNDAGDPTNGDRDADDADTPSDADRPPEDVRKYERFKKVDGAQYDRVNDFLRERTYITAREWAIARLCADFRTETGVEMTKIGDNLPYLVPFMTDTYSPQAVNQARHAFREKVRKSGATFLYGAMCGFFTAEELDELMYEV